MKKRSKKIIAISTMVLIGTGALVGCTQAPTGYTQEEINAAKVAAKDEGFKDGVAEGKASVDQTTNDEEVNLRVIETLRNRYKCKVGYSGHEVGLAVSYGAAALGITSLERHITLSRAMFGSDQAASVEPAAFIQLCGAVRKIQRALGDGIKRVTEGELSVRKKLRGY